LRGVKKTAEGRGSRGKGRGSGKKRAQYSEGVAILRTAELKKGVPSSKGLRTGAQSDEEWVREKSWGGRHRTGKSVRL